MTWPFVTFLVQTESGSWVCIPVCNGPERVRERASERASLRRSRGVIDNQQVTEVGRLKERGVA